MGLIGIFLIVIHAKYMFATCMTLEILILLYDPFLKIFKYF